MIWFDVFPTCPQIRPNLSIRSPDRPCIPTAPNPLGQYCQPLSFPPPSPKARADPITVDNPSILGAEVNSAEAAADGQGTDAARGAELSRCAVLSQRLRRDAVAHGNGRPQLVRSSSATEESGHRQDAAESTECSNACLDYAIVHDLLPDYVKHAYTAFDVLVGGLWGGALLAVRLEEEVFAPAPSASHPPGGQGSVMTMRVSGIVAERR